MVVVCLETVPRPLQARAVNAERRLANAQNASGGPFMLRATPLEALLHASLLLKSGGSRFTFVRVCSIPSHFKYMISTTPCLHVMTLFRTFQKLCLSFELDAATTSSTEERVKREVRGGRLTQLANGTKN